MAEFQLVPQPSIELKIHIAHSMQQYYERNPSADEGAMLTHICTQFSHRVNGTRLQLTKCVMDMITTYGDLCRSNNNSNTFHDQQLEQLAQLHPYIQNLHYALHRSDVFRNHYAGLPAQQPTSSEVKITINDMIERELRRILNEDTTVNIKDNVQLQPCSVTSAENEAEMETNILIAEEMVNRWPTRNGGQGIPRTYLLSRDGTRVIEWSGTINFAICRQMEVYYRMNSRSLKIHMINTIYEELELDVDQASFTDYVTSMIWAYYQLRGRIGNSYRAAVNRESLINYCPHFYHLHKALDYSDYCRYDSLALNLKPRPSVVVMNRNATTSNDRTQ